MAGSSRCGAMSGSTATPKRYWKKLGQPSTTLADLFTPLLFADLSSAVRTSLRSWSNDELEDGVAYGRQTRLRWRSVDSFFSAPLVRGGDAGGRRKRSWS